MHEFWNTQPVPENHEEYMGEINTCRDFDPNPIALPEQFEWSECTVKEAAELLSVHYIRDEHFALEYSEQFVEWATTPEWNLGLRTKSGGKLVGFISGMPCKYRVKKDTFDALQINFLCVHDTLRNQRLAPLLISEIRRRANARGIWQAVYTAVAELPGIVAKTEYWHRLLNVPKLNKAKFSQERERSHIVRGSCQHRLMTKEDIPRVSRALNAHMSKYSIAPVIDEDYVSRYLMPVDDIVYTYIDDNDHVTSYYSVPYTSVKTGIHIKQAYMFYDTGVGDLKNAVILARNAGFDVYNTLDVGLDSDILSASKFMEGNGHNHCYVYNWSCGDIHRNSIFMRFF
jgi:glycylpeptide N-tetradecanoyltransferase